MGATRVFVGFRKDGEIEVIDTWTRDDIAEDYPILYFARVGILTASLGWKKTLATFDGLARTDATSGLLESAIEYFLEAVQENGRADASTAGVVADVDTSNFAAGVVFDRDARALELYHPVPVAASSHPRGAPVQGFSCRLRITENKLDPAADVLIDIYNRAFGGEVELPNIDDASGWEERLVLDGDDTMLTAPTPSEDDADQDDGAIQTMSTTYDDEGNATTVTRTLYPFMAVAAQEAPLMVATTCPSDDPGGREIVYIDLAQPGAMTFAYAPYGPYAIWTQPLPEERVFDMQMGILMPHDLTREFDFDVATKVTEGVLAEDDGDIEGDDPDESEPGRA